MSSLKRIVSHDDFDGLISATICSHALNIEDIQFAGPRLVAEAHLSITVHDVVCDLPYPLECGMWFDHHEGNLEELTFRGIDVQTIKGRFEAKKSCARVVFDYFTELEPLPSHFAAMVDEADVIDAFDYSSIEDWRRETPGKVIDSSLKLQSASKHEKWEYLRHLIDLLKHDPVERIAAREEVRKRFAVFQEEERAMMAHVEQNISFLPEDRRRRIILLDLTHLKRQPRLMKNLAFLLYPQAVAIIEVKNKFQGSTKTNDLSISMSLNLNVKSEEGLRNVGDIMRQLNIGSGHRGAGAGAIHCSSKREMVQKKNVVLRDIVHLFEGG